MPDIPLCPLEQDPGLLLGSDTNISFNQNISTILTGGLLIRTFCKFTIYNADNFPIANRLIVSANGSPIRLYNNCENLPLNQRPVIGGPDFNTVIDNERGPFFQVPEGGYVLVTNYGSFYQLYSWITVAGYRVGLEMKDCADIQYTKIDEFDYPIYGSGLYGFQTIGLRYWWGRDFQDSQGSNVIGYEFLPKTTAEADPVEPTDLQREQFSWVWGRPWDLILT